jgi:hypothetical protein
MSEIKVNSIKGVGASAAAITVNNTDGTCTANVSSIGSSQLSNRNKLINGENLISQRGTSETGVASTKYAKAPDRWQFYAYPSSESGTYTVSQDSTAPNGFQKSYKVECTTADTSLQADSGVILRQTIEEQNLHDFHKGFSDAKQFSLSFYVKTTKTGTYVCELYDMRNTRHVSATYTVSDTNWNRYTITFPADTTGAFTSGSYGGGMIVHWWLVAGTNYTSGSLGTTWGSTAANRAVGQLNFADSTSNNFYLTGCQLEVGAVSTSYEHKLVSQELADCMRYYQIVIQSGGGGGGNTGGLGGTPYSNGSSVYCPYRFPVEMRAEPSMESTSGTGSGSGTFRTRRGNNYNFNSFASMNDANNTSTTFVTNGNGGGGDVGAYIWIETNAGAKLALDAEI